MEGHRQRCAGVKAGRKGGDKVKAGHPQKGTRHNLVWLYFLFTRLAAVFQQSRAHAFNRQAREERGETPGEVFLTGGGGVSLKVVSPSQVVLQAAYEVRARSALLLR